MAETVQIEVKFNPKNLESVFGLPYRIEVEKGDTIEWIIKDPLIFKEIFFSSKKRIYGVKFTLYFEDTTPFQWKTESLRILGRFPPFYPDRFPIKIATGIADKKGDHKYGLKLVSLENENKGEPDFDDDPYLRVY
ncbi:hypothetical protein [Kordia zhangzhouensis]|uniref:hypothetical protein n=1 Tax=Kordia zhangzhouensis TaxID=1620405 RepID=UPI0006291992|nr:hypothetical protein [Kordia zhangzhouensis]